MPNLQSILLKMAHPLSTISKIRTANKKAGHYFFSPETMRFFRSKAYGIVRTTEKGAFFITSEDFKASDGFEDRSYKVRFCHLSGEVDAHSQTFSSYDEARNCLEQTENWERDFINKRKQQMISSPYAIFKA